MSARRWGAGAANGVLFEDFEGSSLEVLPSRGVLVAPCKAFLGMGPLRFAWEEHFVAREDAASEPFLPKIPRVRGSCIEVIEG